MNEGLVYVDRATGTRLPVTVVGNKMYVSCGGCGKAVQVNKPIIGAVHFCA